MVPADLKEYIGAWHAEWLYTGFFSNRFLFFDFWSFNHFGSGFFLYLIVQALAPKRKWIIALMVLILYEAAEILLVYFSLGIFHPESLSDQITDIGIGMAGALLASLIFNRCFLNKYQGNMVVRFADAWAVVVAAYFFTGFYHYTLQPESVDTGQFCFVAFGCWVIAGAAMTASYQTILKKLSRKPAAMASTLAIYLVFSFVWINLAVELTGIKDISIRQRPLLIAFGRWIFPLAYLLPPLLLAACIWLSRTIMRRASEAAAAKSPSARSILAALLVFLFFMLAGYLFNQSLAGRKWLSKLPVSTASPPAELVPGDIIIRTNNRWFPGSAWMPRGRYAGHAGIVVNHVKSKNSDSLLSKAIIIESVLYDQQEKHYIWQRSQQLRYVFAARSFGPKYKGCRYILHLDIDSCQRRKLVEYIKNCHNQGYNYLALKSDGSLANRTLQRWLPFTARQNCAVLTWNIFYLGAGFDLDANGGWFVFPNDIILSPYFDRKGWRYNF